MQSLLTAAADSRQAGPFREGKLASKDKDICHLKERIEASTNLLDTNRKQSETYMRQFEDTLAQKRVLQEHLDQTKEELEAKLYIVQQLNERLATLETELTSQENEHRVSTLYWPLFYPLFIFRISPHCN